jgi:hypothetical protein
MSPPLHAGRRQTAATSRSTRIFRPVIDGTERLEIRLLLSLTYTDFALPMVSVVAPDGVTKGPDGNVWFSENVADKIGRMTPAGA